MGKPKFSREVLSAAIVEYNGNVSAMARALNCKPQTVYNTLDRYGMRNELQKVRDECAVKWRKKLFEHLRAAQKTRYTFQPIEIAYATACMAQLCGLVTPASLERIKCVLKGYDALVFKKWREGDQE